MCKVLHTRTTKDIDGVVMKAIVFTSTKPTPLVIASTTCHVITAWHFLNSYFALGTILNILTRCPFLKILIHSILTPYIAMPLNATIKTDFKSTFTSHSSFLAFLNISIAVWSWTPLQVRVYVYINVLFEFQVLIIDFLRPKLSDFIPSELILALILSTLNLFNLTISDVIL
jgi:hypothetical protein